jgi:transglutaminase-like putative cysteine protease
MKEYLCETAFLNFQDISFDAFTAEIDSNQPEKEKAIALYYLVRDAFLYDPYHLDLTHEGLTASKVLSKKRSWCVEKSSVLAACLRKFDIPSRLGYAIVTNHIGVEKLTNYLRRDEIVFHGFVDVYLNGVWVKCTPAFDQRICRVSGVKPLDWDGETDSLFQEFDQGKKFMEYKHFYGTFNDVPIELMNAEMKAHYPHLFEEVYDSKEFSFYHL